MPATFAAPEIFAVVDFFGVLEVFAARTGADFFVAWREADLRDAAARVVDLRTV
jgi:hypothetical protein